MSIAEQFVEEYARAAYEVCSAYRHSRGLPNRAPWNEAEREDKNVAIAAARCVLYPTSTCEPPIEKCPLLCAEDVIFSATVINVVRAVEACA